MPLHSQRLPSPRRAATGNAAQRRFAFAFVFTFGRFLLLLAALFGAWCGPSLAQTTSGNSATGSALFTSVGCDGCHTLSSSDNRINAANAAGVIDYALAQDGITGMGYLSGSLSGQDKNDLAAYIATFIAALPTQTVNYNTATAINVSDPILNSTVGSFTSLQAGGTAPTKGSLSFSGSTITYTPGAGNTGADSFTYRASGPAGTSSERTVNVTISSAPAPTVQAFSVSATSGQAMTIDLSAHISGTTAASAAIASAPGHGTANLSGFVVTYTPSSTYVGSDTFTYTATATAGLGGQTSAPATVTITVNAQSTAAGPLSLTVPLNTATTVDLAPYITGTLVTGVNIGTAPAHGSATMNGTRVTYTPRHDYFGNDSFTYVAHGAGGASTTATVTVTVVGRPDPLQDAGVTRLLKAQTDTAKRFAFAPLVNFNQRMESLHRRGAGGRRGNRLLEGGSRFALNGSPASGFPTPRSAPMANALVGGRADAASAIPAEALLAQAAPGVPAQGASAPGGDGALGAGKSSAPADPALALAALGLQGAASRTLNLGAFSPRGERDGGINVWVAGNVRFGTRDGDAARFHTDGVTVGADLAIDDRLSVGAGVTYGRDHTRSNTDHSSADSDASSLAVYGSYEFVPGTFLDAVVGYGQLRYDNDRHVSAIGDFARSNRRGQQFFASLTAAYEFEAEGFLLSPYGRATLAHTRLDSAREHGAGAYALHYGEQDASSAQLAIGLRAEATHQADFGLLLPHLRVEYQRGLDHNGSANLHYADQLGGAGYTLGSVDTRRNGFVLGLGSDFVFWNGLRLGIDYQTLRSPHGENSQSVGLRLTKELDGPGLRAGDWGALTLPVLRVNVDGGVTHDDNVSRTVNGPDKVSDESYSANLRKSWNIPLGAQTRAVVNGFFGGEKFHTYVGLNHLTLGGQVELQYRTSGDFLAPTFGVFTRLSAENYQSTMRDGYRSSTGVSLRQPVTDRINLFGALAHNTRHARDKVFDTRDTSARLNVDYQVTATSSLYLTGEYRLGDVVSSGQASLRNLDMAKAFARDDVFVSPQLFDYRFRGRTILSTLGYSLPLGPTDAIDFSWRHIRAQPLDEPSYVTTHTRYYVNQISFSYLGRF